MPRAIRIASLVILIGALTAGSPVYAESHDAPGMMQEGGDMQATGMEGMMGMMEQMNKVMTLCTKMMEGTMTEMDQESDPAKAP